MCKECGGSGVCEHNPSLEAKKEHTPVKKETAQVKTEAKKEHTPVKKETAQVKTEAKKESAQGKTKVKKEPSMRIEAWKCTTCTYVHTNATERSFLSCAVCTDVRPVC